MGMMEDKVVIVTGAGRGIGRGIAMLMAEQGAKVVVNELGGGAAGERRGQRAANRGCPGGSGAVPAARLAPRRPGTSAGPGAAARGWAAADASYWQRGEIDARSVRTWSKEAPA